MAAIIEKYNQTILRSLNNEKSRNVFHFSLEVVISIFTCSSSVTLSTRKKYTFVDKHTLTEVVSRYQ